MNNERFEEITSSIQEKLGDENSAIIADDLGNLLTENTNIFNQLQEQQNTINKLKDEKEKLILANGNLLKQVPVQQVEPKVDEPKENKHFSFYDAFDEKGNFKK